ncbi:hypothetical protein [Duganella vulcania]|nr:hypothetical protein [Duganella vulcania]
MNRRAEEGAPGIFIATDKGNMHGLNENVPVKSVRESQHFL